MFSRENSRRSARRAVFSIASRQIGKERAHFGVALQMSLGISGEQFARGIEMGVLADAGEDIEHLAAVWAWRIARHSSR